MVEWVLMSKDRDCEAPLMSSQEKLSKKSKASVSSYFTSATRNRAGNTKSQK